MTDYVIPFENLRNTDVGSVGGKNASLGEMISQLTQKEIRVPPDLQLPLLHSKNF